MLRRLQNTSEKQSQNPVCTVQFIFWNSFLKSYLKCVLTTSGSNMEEFSKSYIYIYIVTRNCYKEFCPGSACSNLIILAEFFYENIIMLNSLSHKTTYLPYEYEDSYPSDLYISCTMSGKTAVYICPSNSVQHLSHKDNCKLGQSLLKFLDMG